MRERPQVIWSTYPIATAHLIGWMLHRISGVRWVADFRDPMVEESFPKTAADRRVYAWVERGAVMNAARCVFTTPGTLRRYRERYGQAIDGKAVLIPNGYDEEDFAKAEARVQQGVLSHGTIRLLHSGILYPEERDPRAFFDALCELRREGRLSDAQLQVVFRGSGHDARYLDWVASRGLSNMVEFRPGVAHEQALQEMLSADGLLIFQASNCNDQIPAKLYEYLRARRPILAITDMQGDTAATLRAFGMDSIAAWNDTREIKARLLQFLQAVRSGVAPLANAAMVDGYSRRAQTATLASLLDGLE